MNTAAVTIDHPAWVSASGDARRVVRSGAGIWLVAVVGGRLDLACVSGAGDRRPALVEICASDLPDAAPAPLARALRELGVVYRLSNPCLWDALSTAILRQVVRAAQARRLYQRWCATYGTRSAGELAVAPDPDTVLSLTDAELSAAGAAFHGGALRAAAAAYLEHHEAWASASPEELVQALLAIPRIGPWTARAAAADYTGDFSIYPHRDLAVRSWARRAAPDISWPEGTRAFERTWTSFAETNHQLHTLTALTLTWGSHASICHDPDGLPCPI